LGARITKRAGWSIFWCKGGYVYSLVSARTVGRSEDDEAAVVLALTSSQPPYPGGEALGPDQSWPGTVASLIRFDDCWGEETDGNRRLPQLKQKLSPGRTSEPQVGHLSIAQKSSLGSFIFYVGKPGLDRPTLR